VPPPNFGYAPRESRPRFEAASAGAPVPATVKWYNEKGFGFVQLPTGGDAFLHVSVVERSGNSAVPPGATLEVRVGPGQKGQQVTELLSVDASTALHEPPRRPRPERTDQRSDQAVVEETGTVKFYAADKGFGFDRPRRRRQGRFRRCVGFDPRRDQRSGRRPAGRGRYG
jgi:CspA family cold shock protein